MDQFSEYAAMDNQKGYHGSMIAFEGPENLVSTQLRLLPTSPQLLILPGLQQYMKEHNGTWVDSRSCIRDVQQAAVARHEAALRFLNKATSDNKRLVFLNGGTAAAVSQCISTISEHQTSGDLVLAEAIYKNLAGEGAKALEQITKHENQQALDKLNSERDLAEALWEDDNEDPITKAMRAADALYKETEFLQPIDCYIRTRPRSLSLPMLDFTNELGQASPFFVFGTSPSEGTPSVCNGDEEESNTKGADEDLNRTRSVKKLQAGQKLKISVPRRSASIMAEAVRTRNGENRTTLQLFSADGIESPPITPEGVVYGEARLVQMQAKSQDLRKVRSLDDMELVEARRRRISVHLPAAMRASPLESPEAKSRHLSIVDDPYSPNNNLHFPAAKFVKAQTTTIRKSPTFLQKTFPTPARDTYVHQGTDVADFDCENVDPEAAFEPVLPLLEDLVVHFTSFCPDYLLASVIQSFKDGVYPILNNISESSGTADTDSCPSTPRTADLFDLEVNQGDGLYTVPEVPSGDEASDYDPYAARGNDVRYASKIAMQQPSPISPNMRQPPMPTHTTAALHVGAKFHDLSNLTCPNAIDTQNALRSVLEGYYPQKEGSGYVQFNSPMLSDLDNMWRPMFRHCEGKGSRPTEHIADLILAIGGQKGVKSDFVSALTGQIEKLGSKSNGISRSGRLDIRFLIASAMQSYSTHPLTSLPDCPLSESPYSLACFLIPQLETYLATNTATRFLLLSYPPEHLPTVLALQKIIGANTFKVAGILDSSDPSTSTDGPSSSSAISTSTSTSTSSSHSLTTIETSIEASASNIPTPPPLSTMNEMRSRLARRRRVSFSRADYVLPSSATQADITVLISTIWNDLIDIDSFYTPEPTEKSSLHGSSRGRPPRALPTLVSKFTNPTSPPFTPNYRHDGTAATTPRSLITMDFPYPPPLTPQSVRNESPSRASVRSGRGRQHQHIASTTEWSRRGDDTVSVMDEGDFDEAEERRLMPMYMRQSEMRKGNSRKALKWLGLA